MEPFFALSYCLYGQLMAWIGLIVPSPWYDRYFEFYTDPIKWHRKDTLRRRARNSTVRA